MKLPKHPLPSRQGLGTSSWRTVYLLKDSSQSTYHSVFGNPGLWLVHKTTQEAIKKSPLEGHLCLALWHCFQWKLALAVLSVNLELQLALSSLTYSNCNAVHRVKVTPVFIRHMPSKYHEENTMWPPSEDQKRRGKRQTFWPFQTLTQAQGYGCYWLSWLVGQVRDVYWQRNKYHSAPVRCQGD